MVQFDEQRRNHKIEQLREKEEEALVEILSQKYGVPYADLTLTPINTDALNLIPEVRSRDALVAVFNKIGKKVDVAVRSPAHEKDRKSVV